MISLRYSCKCGWSSTLLDDAQGHANATQHHVDVLGSISPVFNVTAQKQKIERAAKDKAWDAQVMRVARERGLLK